eukprot:12520914-Ditylum_brightwellii.AAC.1
MEDQEGGKTDFLEAISLLGNGNGNNDEIMEDGDAAATTATTTSLPNAMEIAQRHEMKAGLHLYIGQLSSAEEALQSYKHGVIEWTNCISILERVGDGNKKEDDDMEEEGGEKVSAAEALTEAK